jgi:hypothetical protein
MRRILVKQLPRKIAQDSGVIEVNSWSSNLDIPEITVQNSMLSSTFPKKKPTAQGNGSLTCIYCASPVQFHTVQGTGFHYRFSCGDRVQIISCKHKGATGTVDANVFQRSVDCPNEHTSSYLVLLDSDLVVTVNVNKVEALYSTR